MSNSNIALIVGITGQDGAYLANLLLKRGYKVFGSSRDIGGANLFRLEKLNIKNDIEFVSTLPNDFRSITKTILKTKPTEIYNLAGQTSVGLSFEQPIEAIDSIANSTINWLEAIRLINQSIKFFNAGSSECFGDTSRNSATEKTAFMPRSPYSIAKSTAFWYVQTYRESYNLKCCTGIMSNHESPLRSERFVTQKIVKGVHAIKSGELDKLILGNIDIYRDWGWSPDYVEAIHKMLTENSNYKDFIIASGKTNSLRNFIEKIFAHAELNYEDFIVTDEKLLRPNDLVYSSLDPNKIFSVLGWKAKSEFDSIIDKMYHSILF